MKNEDQVCNRLREIFNFPSHVPNELVLKLTKDSYSLASVRLKVNWKEFVKKISVPFKQIIETIKNG